MTARNVGIDIHLYKARKILEDVNIPIETAILLLAQKGGLSFERKDLQEITPI